MPGGDQHAVGDGQAHHVEVVATQRTFHSAFGIDAVQTGVRADQDRGIGLGHHRVDVPELDRSLRRGGRCGRGAAASQDSDSSHGGGERGERAARRGTETRKHQTGLSGEQDDDRGRR